MEKHGLIKCLDLIEDVGVEIKTLVTDRHTQICKYLREERGYFTHQFDVWHITNNLKKKILKKANKKSCTNLQQMDQIDN